MKKIRSISSFIIGVCILGYAVYRYIGEEGYLLGREFLYLLIIGSGLILYGLFYERFENYINDKTDSEKQ